MTENLEKPKKSQGFILRPLVRTPLEEEILGVSGEVRRTINAGMENAASLTDFSLHYRAIANLNRGDIGWMWNVMDAEELTPDAVLAHFIHDQQREEAAKDEKFVKEVLPTFDELEEDSSKIKIGMRRIRDKYGNYTYRVLAQFPGGVQSTSPILGYADQDFLNEHPDTVMYQPQTACTLHACDDIFRTIRKSPSVIPYKTRQEALDAVQYDSRGINEYQLEKTGDSVIKQDAANYITVALQNGYSNEPYVIPVSRFPYNLSKMKS